MQVKNLSQIIIRVFKIIIEYTQIDKIRNSRSHEVYIRS